MRVCTKKKSTVFWILLSLFVSITAHSTLAEEGEVIFEEWVDHEEQFEINELAYSFFVISDDLEKAKLSAQRYGTFFFQKGTSQETETMRVEYVETREKEQAAPDEDPRRNYQYYLKITRYEAGVEIGRETNKEYPFYRDTFNITITIENEEDEQVKELLIEQELPDNIERVGEIEIERRSGNKVSRTDVNEDYRFGNVIKWNGFARAGEFVAVTQTLRVLERNPENKIVIPPTKVTYKYKNQPYEKDLPEISLSLGDPLSLTIEPNKDEVAYGERVKYAITLKNKHNSEQIIINNMSIIIPPTMVLYSKPTEIRGSKKDPTRLYWSGKLDQGLNAEFIVEFEVYGKENTLKVESTHSYEGLTIRKERTQTTEVPISEISAEIRTDKSSYQGEEKAKISFFIDNPNSKINFQNVKIKLISESGMFPEESHIFNIAANEKKLARTIEATLQNVEDNAKLQVRMEGTYETSVHEEFSLTVAKLIAVKPNEQMLKTLIAKRLEEEAEREQLQEERKEKQEQALAEQQTQEAAAAQAQAEQEEKEQPEVTVIRYEEEEKKLWPYLLAFIASIGVLTAVVIGFKKLREKHEKKRGEKDKKKHHEGIRDEIQEEVEKILNKIR